MIKKRKSKIKIIFIVLGAIIALILGFGLINYFPMLSMKPIETGFIQDSNIYAIKDSINSIFLYDTGAGFVLFDAGSNAKNIEAALREARINVNDVKWIFLTHSDGDHIGGLPLFYNADIYLNRDELPLLNGTAKRAFYGGNNLPAGITIDRFLTLTDGQEFNIGGTKVRCISTKGHTIGSMAYLLNDRYLFTGDALKLKNGKTSVHPFTMDKKTASAAIDKLKSISDNGVTIITSHYGIY